MAMRQAVLALGVGVAASGCWLVERAVIRSVDNTVDNATSQAVNQQPAMRGSSRWGAGMDPMMQRQMMMMYTQYLFSMAFSSGGFAVSTVDYRPGEYTRWKLNSGGDSAMTLERARLFDDADGSQWWKVKWTSQGGDGSDTIIIEALVSPRDQKMERARGLFPGDTAPKEIPVTEGTGYVPPQKLSAKSVAGATVGTESVTVPAGTYTARKVVYGEMAGNYTWWLFDKVPGGIVKQLVSSQGGGGGGGPDSSNYSMELMAFGTGAVTELGTK